MAKDDPGLPRPLQFAQEVDRLFDELIHRPWGFRTASETEWNPQLDLYETDSAFILEVDLPGVREEDVSVTVERGNLLLHGRRSFERIQSGKNFYHHERRAGQFNRRVPLPASVNQEAIQAEFGQSVLRVTLPKIQRERKADR